MVLKILLVALFLGPPQLLVLAQPGDLDDRGVGLRRVGHEDVVIYQVFAAALLPREKDYCLRMRSALTRSLEQSFGH